MSLGSSKSLIIMDFSDFHEIHGFPSNLMGRSSRSGWPRSSGTSFHLGKLLLGSVSKGLSKNFTKSHDLVCGSLTSRSVDVTKIAKILDYQGFWWFSWISWNFMKSDGAIITIRLVQTIGYLIPPRETAFRKCFERFIKKFRDISRFSMWIRAVEFGRCYQDRQNPWLSRILVIFMKFHEISWDSMKWSSRSG